MRAIIMAGGKGTRIASVNAALPKPMLRVCGKPILEHQLERLAENDIREITIVTGHLGSSIPEYFGNGARLGVNIHYFQEVQPLGTAGALYYLKDEIHEDVLLLNGDLIFDIDLPRMLDFHRNKQAEATILTHPNNHPYDSALVVADPNGRVTRWLHKQEPRGDCQNRVNAGIHILSPRAFARVPAPEKINLDHAVLEPMVGDGTLFAYDSPEYVFDVGTPERLAQVSEDIACGTVAARNLRHRQKAVFLDRDGTINKMDGFVTRPDQIQLLPGVSEALARLNRSAFLAIVVTNQPVIARGDCTFDELRTIHNRLETLLGNAGAYYDDLFFCPHHPDGGFPGERTDYKMACDCRKPMPGMLLEAAQKYNIDLAKSHMVGDATADVLAGIAAGCKPWFIGEQGGLDASIGTVHCVSSLAACVEEILLNGGTAL